MLLFVNIYHGRQSYEIGFEIGRLKPENSEVYCLPTVLKALAPNYNGSIFFQASSNPTLKNRILDVANIVLTYCSDVLEGSEAAFKKLEKASEEIAGEIKQLYTIQPVKERAQEAWQKKDFKEVVRLYQSIEPELGNVEMKRMKYAEKKLHA